MFILYHLHIIGRENVFIDTEVVLYNENLHTIKRHTSWPG